MYKFELKLYKNKSDNNVLDKVLTNEYILTGISRNEVNILSPVILVSVPRLNINDYNYCYITELKRYYYIVNTTINADNTIRVSFRVDVLKTYIEDIKASRGLITKQAVYNPYYGEYDIEAQIEQRKLEFQNAFSENSEYVLVALRG